MLLEIQGRGEEYSLEIQRRGKKCCLENPRRGKYFYAPIEFPGRVCNSKTFSTGVW